MHFDVFFNFGGNCREALDFYAKVFKTEVKSLMTYGETPPDPNYTLNEADKDKIMYAEISFGNVNAMFMDMPSGAPLAVGNNVTPTISFDNKEEVMRVFGGLAEGGTVNEELTKTFFSELYGMVTDKFGIIWQVLYNPAE